MTVRHACRLAVIGAVVAAETVVFAPAGHACACGATVTPSGTHAGFNHEVALAHWNGSTETTPCCAN
jgi:hypothetical protein